MCLKINQSLIQFQQLWFLIKEMIPVGTKQQQLVRDTVSGDAEISLFLPQQLDQVWRISQREDLARGVLRVVEPGLGRRTFQGGPQVFVVL